MTSSQPRFRAEVLWSAVIASICGALSGAAAGFLTDSWRPIETGAVIVQAPTSTSATSATTTNGITLVPLERRSVESLVPPAFASRRASPVAAVYRKPKGVALEERFLNEDRLLGHAVALTSDGWFVASDAVFADVKVADVVLWVNGESFAVTGATHDRLNGTVFLKTDARSLTASPFARLTDLTSGASVWMETRAGEFTPDVVRSVKERTDANSVFTSEEAHRLVRLSSLSGKGDRGAPVWDPNGSLVGIIESDAGEPAILIPASGIAASFGSLLSTGEIRHASLGVRALDLATLMLDGSRGSLPMAGAWLRDDKKTGKTAVARDSSAAKAGLRAGDVIQRVERDILDGTADLGEILADYRPGASVTLRVWRDGTDFDLPVVLGSVTTSEALK